MISILLASLLFMELNVENLFDTQHDLGKNDWEFLPDGALGWTASRYWNKLNKLGKVILAAGASEQRDQDYMLPDLVALCEIENDTCMRDLTQRSILRKARYEYIMTDSEDERGIDVALLYSPFSFAPISHRSIKVPRIKGMKPTRDLLYVCGRTPRYDTLHIIVTHAPSRSGGEKATQPYRMQVVHTICNLIDSVRRQDENAKIILTGDFNATNGSQEFDLLKQNNLYHASEKAIGCHDALGTYRYRGTWGSLDHFFISKNLSQKITRCYVFDAPYLLVQDEKYNGVKPRRNYQGPIYRNGYSDHLPLLLELCW